MDLDAIKASWWYEINGCIMLLLIIHYKPPSWSARQSSKLCVAQKLGPLNEENNLVKWIGWFLTEWLKINMKVFLFHIFAWYNKGATFVWVWIRHSDVRFLFHFTMAIGAVFPFWLWICSVFLCKFKNKFRIPLSFSPWLLMLHKFPVLLLSSNSKWHTFCIWFTGFLFCYSYFEIQILVKFFLFSYLFCLVLLFWLTLLQFYEMQNLFILK